MRNSLSLSIVSWMATTSLLLASEQGRNDRQEADRGIAIVWAGPTNTVLFSSVNDFVGANYRCPLHIKPAQGALKDWSDGSISNLTSLVEPSDICLLVLAAMPTDSTLVEQISKHRNLALLNVTALAPKKTDKNPQPEKYLRRVEKESMRMVGELLGLSVCPFPRCALSITLTDRELDDKGLNLCPPCDLKAQQVLLKDGVVPKVVLPASRSLPVAK